MSSVLYNDWSHKSRVKPNLESHIESPKKEWGNVLISTNLLDANPGTIRAPTFWQTQQKAKIIQLWVISVFSLLAVAAVGAGIYCSFHYPKIAFILIAPFTLSLLGCLGPTVFFKIMHAQKKNYLKGLREGDAPYKPSELGYLKQWINTDDLNRTIRKDFLCISSTKLEDKYGKEVAAIYQQAWGLETVKNECNQLLKNLKDHLEKSHSVYSNAQEYQALSRGISELETFFNDADETNYIAKINLFVQQLADLPHSRLLLEAPQSFDVKNFYDFLGAFGTHTEGAGFVSVILNNGVSQELVTIPLLTALQSPIISKDCRGQYGKVGKNCQITINLENESDRIFWHLWAKLSFGDSIKQNDCEMQTSIQDNILQLLHLASEVYNIKNVETFCLVTIQNMLSEVNKEDQEEYLEALSTLFEFAMGYNHIGLQKICFSELKMNSYLLIKNLKTSCLKNRDQKGYIDFHYELDEFQKELDTIFEDINSKNYEAKITLFLTKLTALPHAKLLKHFPQDPLPTGLKLILYFKDYVACLLARQL